MKSSPSSTAPPAVSCIRFVRPSLAEWTELQRRADNAVNGCIVHCVRSIIGWMRELYNAPTWSEGHSKLWTHYTAALNAELRPNTRVKITSAKP